jgi:SAM-dependent methyltransferase
MGDPGSDDHGIGVPAFSD